MTSPAPVILLNVMDVMFDIFISKIRVFMFFPCCRL